MPAKTGAHHGMRYGYNNKEAGWGTAMSEDKRRIDNLMTRAVKDFGLNTPPGSPGHGHRYIVGSSPTGAWAGMANQIAAYDNDAATWIFYVPEKGWDVFVDDEGRTVEWTGSSWRGLAQVTVDHFTTVQAAVDAISAIGGGDAKCSARTYDGSSTPSFAGVTIPDRVNLLGADFGATELNCAGMSTSAHAVTITGDYASVANLTIRGQNASGTGHGVHFGNGGDPGRHSWVVNCEIFDTPSWGVYFTGSPGSNIWILSGVEECRIYEPESGGCVYAGPGCTTIWLIGVNMPSATVGGAPLVKLEGVVDWVLDRCTLEPGTDSPCLEVASGGLYIRKGICQNTYFENHNATGSKYFIEATGSAGAQIGVTFINCKFSRYPEGANLAPKILRLASTNTGSIRAFRLVDCTVREKRTSGSAPHNAGSASTYTDDILIEGQAHEIIIDGGAIWDAQNAILRGFSYSTAGGGSASLASVIDRGYRRFQLPRMSANDAETVGMAVGIAGGQYYDTTNDRIRVYIGGTGWRTVTHS